jgi:hypothetical protein
MWMILKAAIYRYAFSLCLESFFHPDRNVRSTYDFNAISNDLSYGLKELNWPGTIDPIFYTQKPAELQIMTCHSTVLDRYSEELYPLTDIAQGQSQVINTLDLSYYPSEGPL